MRMRSAPLAPPPRLKTRSGRGEGKSTHFPLLPLRPLPVRVGRGLHRRACPGRSFMDRPHPPSPLVVGSHRQGPHHLSIAVRGRGGRRTAAEVLDPAADAPSDSGGAVKPRRRRFRPRMRRPTMEARDPVAEVPYGHGGVGSSGGCAVRPRMCRIRRRRRRPAVEGTPTRGAVSLPPSSLSLPSLSNTSFPL
jgi:hypothetical protein